MKNSIPILIPIAILIIPTTSYSQEKWTKSNKLLLASFTLGQFVNYSQTNYVYTHNNWHEINPATDFLSSNGNHLLEYKIASTILVGLSAHVFPKQRKWILRISNVVVWSFVAHDVYVGVGFHF